MAVTTGIDRCASCGLPEAEHQDADMEAARVFAALAGCAGFRITAAQAVQPRRDRGRKLCGRCGRQGHAQEVCPW